MTIDSHQHFWYFDPERHSWIDDSMALLKRNFLPFDLRPLLAGQGIDGCIAVQADQTEDETTFLLDLAASYDFIKGVVGWIDLRAENIEARLEYFSQFERLCGFRHIVQGESDVNFLLRSSFRRGIALLENHQFTYDLLVFPHQLGAVLEFVRAFPRQMFVIDHLAKPYIRDGFFDGWATLMRAIAQHENVWCKVSGMVTEADWSGWRYSNFVPYLDLVFESFGPSRILYGSDWPVCLLGGSYQDVKGIIDRYISQLSVAERQGIWGDNAVAFYGLGE